MSSDERRLTAEQIIELVELRPAAELDPWDGDPWRHDIGTASTLDEHFGKDIVYVWGDMVVKGWAIVEAETIDGRDNGDVAVVNFAKAGWSLNEATAAVLARRLDERATVPDSGLLAERLAQLRETDRELAEKVGFTESMLDRVAANIRPPSPLLNPTTHQVEGPGQNPDDYPPPPVFDVGPPPDPTAPPPPPTMSDLADEFGELTDEDTWDVVRVQVPKEVNDRWVSLLDGRDPTEVFTLLLDLYDLHTPEPA